MDLDSIEDLNSSVEVKVELPSDINILDNQVAGHAFNKDKNTIGLLIQNDGKLLKPIMKPLSGEREIEFYESLKSSDESLLRELLNYVPAFYGTRNIFVEDKLVTFMIIENLANHLFEPSIIDIKIGRITWDPLAGPTKIESEKNKYSGTKDQLGLSLPGFQVRDVETGNILRFGKKYGRGLNVDSFKTSLKVFLNAKYGLNRHLLIEILTQLWDILKWCRSQRKFRFFSSSVLIVYDTYYLRQCNESLSNCDENDNCSSEENLWHSLYKNSNKINSNNYKDYEERLKMAMKQIGDNHKKWVRVKLIDFAHVFPSIDDQPDNNYLEGFENLVKIFEEFLNETYIK